MATHGSNSYFEFDSVDLTTYITSMEIPESIDSVETTTLTGAAGGAKKTYIPGNEDATITVELIWDPALVTALNNKKGSVLGFVAGPEGSVSTDRRITGNAFLTGVTTSTDVNDAVKASATFQVTGGVTHDTFP